MDFPGLFGGSYEAQSIIADCERTVNLYPEQAQVKTASAPKALYPVPGVRVLSNVGSGLGRANLFTRGRQFCVIGDTLWEIDRAGAYTSRGNVNLDRNPATICTNGDLADQLFVTSGSNGYIYDLVANTLTQITALDGKATMGDFIDEYFLALDANTSTLYVSDLGDGLTWQTGIMWAQRSAAADPWQSMKVVGHLIWLLGEKTSEAWTDVGGLFPFGPYPGGVIQYGIKSPWSPAILGSDMCWLGTTNTGKLCVCKVSGLNVSVISTYPIETAMFNYINAQHSIGDAYSDAGHTFYLLGFDSENITLVYDMETGLWHERGTWIASLGRYSSWRPRFYAYAFGQHRMLDSGGGSILQLDARIATEADGTPIRRMRRCPAVMNGNDRIFYSSIQLLLEPGLGTIIDDGVERGPLVTLRMSNDGGKTWPIPEQSRSAGKLGEYSKRLIWNELGSARRRVFEFTMSDAIPWKIVGCDLQVSQSEIEAQTSQRAL